MKLKYTFELMEMDGDTIAVPLSDGVDGLHGVIKLNKEGALIFSCLQDDITEQELCQKIRECYETDESKIKEYVSEFISQLESNGLIEF